MQSVRFGRRCGLMVSEYALGTPNFGTTWGWGADRAKARAIFDGFAEAGGTFLDTANSHQYGEAESLVGDSSPPPEGRPGH